MNYYENLILLLSHVQCHRCSGSGKFIEKVIPIMPDGGYERYNCFFCSGTGFGCNSWKIEKMLNELSVSYK